MSWTEPQSEPSSAIQRFGEWLIWFLAEVPPALFGNRFDPEPVKHLCYVLSAAAALVSVTGIVYSGLRDALVSAYVIYGGFGVFSELCFRAGRFFSSRERGDGR
jgi:hypothetical protein